jgi:hypothetical protein
VKQVVVFNASRRVENIESAYEAVQEQANTWLEEHPNTNILASHTNMAAETEWTEFSLTLIVELPEGKQAHG